MNRIYIFSLALLLAVSGASAQLSAEPSAAPLQILPQFRDLGIDQHLDAQLPLDLSFRDEAGQTIRLGEYFNGTRPVLLTLVYYRCPNLCTLVLNDTLRSLRAIPLSIGTDFDVVTVSFDPNETPDLAAAKKAQYIASYRRPGAERGWHFLTGSQDSIARLTAAVGFKYQFDAKFNQYIHPSGITILTPQGRISRYFYGIGYAPNDVRLSLVEASNQKIGSLADQILLFCYHYDPTTGKYSVAVLNAVRIFAALITLAMAGFLFIMFRREQRISLAAGSLAKGGT